MATPLQQLTEAYAAGDLDTCEAIIRRTLALNGQPSPPFHKLASTVYRDRREFLNALVHDQSLIKLRPNDPIGYYRSGQDLFNLNRAHEASEVVLQGLKNSGKHHPSLHLIALKAFRSQSNHHSALKHAKALIDLTPEDPLGFIRACQDHLTLDQCSEAKTVATTGLTLHPNNPDLLRLALQITARQPDRSAAIQLAEQLLNTVTATDRDYTIVAEALLKSGDANAAAEFIAAGLQLAPTDLNLLSLGADAARDRDRPEESLSFSEQLMSHHPNQAIGHLRSAELLLARGERTKARDILNSLLHQPLGRDSQLQCRKLLRSGGFRRRARKISKQLVAEGATAQRDDIRELFADHIVLGDLNKARQLADQTGLLHPIEQNRLQSLLGFEGTTPTALNDQDRTLLRRTHTFRQLERASFNPNVNQLLSSSQHKPTIVLIHVGKCAGESLLEAIRLNFHCEEIDLYEFHTFDANQRIEQLISQLQSDQQIHWLICTRDPLQRWISAFNWDTHTFHLSRQYPCHPQAEELHRRYPTAKLLAQGLNNNESDATTYARFHHLAYGHIAMGVSWYVTKQTQQHLNRRQTSIIRTESIQQDFEDAVESILNQFQSLNPRQAVSVPKTKQNYQHRYKPTTFSQFTELSSAERDAIERTIQADRQMHHDLLELMR